MEKTKQVKAHTRKTKSGKTVNVKAHTAKYDSAEDIAKEAIKKTKGAGGEYHNKAYKKPPLGKKQKEVFADSLDSLDFGEFIRVKNSDKFLKEGFKPKDSEANSSGHTPLVYTHPDGREVGLVRQTGTTNIWKLTKGRGGVERKPYTWEMKKGGTDKLGNTYYSDSKGNVYMESKDGKSKSWAKMNPDERRRAGKYLH